MHQPHQNMEFRPDHKDVINTSCSDLLSPEQRLDAIAEILSVIGLRIMQSPDEENR